MTGNFNQKMAPQHHINLVLLFVTDFLPNKQVIQTSHSHPYHVLHSCYPFASYACPASSLVGSLRGDNNLFSDGRHDSDNDCSLSLFKVLTDLVSQFAFRNRQVCSSVSLVIH